MINIILDTNIWIAFVAKDNPTGLVEDLIQKRTNNEIILLTNEIILNEWTRNKQQTIMSVTNRIKEKFTVAQSLSDFLSSAEKKIYLETLNPIFQQEQSRIKLAIERVQRTEELLLSCEITPITDDMKLRVTDWALNKRAPFKKKANSVGDALILLSSVEYCKAKTIGITDSIFVSFNHDDYSSVTDIDLIHEELEGLIGNANMTFTRNIGEALKLAPQLISHISDYIDYQVERWIEWECEIARGK